MCFRLHESSMLRTVAVAGTTIATRSFVVPRLFLGSFETFGMCAVHVYLSVHCTL